MTDKNVTTESENQSTTSTPKVKAGSKKDAKAREKELRSKYEKKTIVLVDPKRIVWACGGAIHLTHMADPSTGRSNNTGKVPEGIHLYDLETIDRAIKVGTIKFMSDVSEAEKTKVEEIEINNEENIDQMEIIDWLLHLKESSLRKEMKRLEEKPNSKELFKKLKEVEITSKNRKGMISVVDEFLK